MIPFLSSHSDQMFASYIYRGLTEGFRIGFDHHSTVLPSQHTNHPFAMENTLVICDHIMAEVANGRLHGPLPFDSVPLVHTSPMGLVPKGHQTNKWRIIVDLSFPAGGSVIDGIPQDLSSMRYASIDETYNIIQQLGRDTLLAKLHIKDVYLIVPVHPADNQLLGIHWEGITYVDRALPFGLQSAPKIFIHLSTSCHGFSIVMVLSTSCIIWTTSCSLVHSGLNPGSAF